MQWFLHYVMQVRSPPARYIYVSTDTALGVCACDIFFSFIHFLSIFLSPRCDNEMTLDAPIDMTSANIMGRLEIFSIFGLTYVRGNVDTYSIGMSNINILTKKSVTHFTSYVQFPQYIQHRKCVIIPFKSLHIQLCRATKEAVY